MTNIFSQFPIHQKNPDMKAVFHSDFRTSWSQRFQSTLSLMFWTRKKKRQNLICSALKLLPWWRFSPLSTLVINRKGTEPKEICSVSGCDKFWDPECLSLASEPLTIEIVFILNVWFSYKVHRLESAFPLSNSTSGHYSPAGLYFDI